MTQSVSLGDLELFLSPYADFAVQGLHTAAFYFFFLLAVPKQRLQKRKFYSFMVVSKW